MRLPDFIIGGAPRSGTSWIYELLDRHPQITMAQPRRPEPKFFLVDEEYERGLAYYSARWFAGIAADQTVGEKSTNYLESPVAAERIAKDLPGIKLIFSLREPAARASSNYRWSRMNGIETEDFPTALALEAERAATCDDRLRYARPYAYFERGMYARHLRRYLDLFPRHQLLVLRFEDLIQHPSGQAAHVHDFLGVTPRPQDTNGLEPVNAAPEGAGDDPDVMATLRARYREPNAELGELLGPGFEIWEGP